MAEIVPFGSTPGQNPRVLNVGGVLRAANLAAIEAQEEKLRKAAIQVQNSPPIQGLARIVRKHWEVARDAKRNTVEPRLIANLRARRGEYEPDKLAEIRQHGGSDVYAMLTSVKCRAAAAWLRDTLGASGTEKPWGIQPTPLPDLPPDIAESIIQKVATHLQQFEAAGIPVSDEELKTAILVLRDRALNEIREKAREFASRMENKMEDQLVEGGFQLALQQFIDDLVTFPAAIIKGPIVRMKPRLRWVQTAGGWELVTENAPHLEWERVSPFDIYPSPDSSGVDDGFLIERHRLSRKDLQELKGVDGYNEDAINLVLEEYGRGGLRDWLWEDVAQAQAEGKHSLEVMTNPDELIDALQYWGCVQGQTLIDEGVDRSLIDDPLKDYYCEVWLVGRYVIKAVLNYDELGRKPYYKASYEEIPGAFWGNGPPDLIKDAQAVVNAAMRALVNNMGIASGPQVGVNVDRLPPGEDITEMHPWKIWQFIDSPHATNGANAPITFFQPNSNAAELIGIIEKFMNFADEWSGIPKYLQGENPGGGAGRTASGLSMMITNAHKGIKQVVANIDNHVLKPLIERLYYWNMKFGDDPDLKGDVQVYARGAEALVAKEAEAVRRNEFLMATANPIDMQIVGLEGRAEVLRETAKNLNMNTDRIVPPREVLRQKLLMQAMMQGQQPQQPQQPNGGSGQELQDGTPTTDNFTPPRKPRIQPQR